MSITFNELLHGHTISDVPIAHQHNLEILLVKVNKLREAWGKPLIVTSGYRSLPEHLNIYRTKFLREGKPLDSKVPMGSQHLSGNAVDFADSDGLLYKWIVENQAVLIANDLWAEKDTKGWIHLQNNPPKSKERFFKP